MYTCFNCSTCTGTCILKIQRGFYASKIKSQGAHCVCLSVSAILLFCHTLYLIFRIVDIWYLFCIIFQLSLTRANEALESEKRDLTVLLDKRSKEIERLNGKKNVVLYWNTHICRKNALTYTFRFWKYIFRLNIWWRKL